MDQGIFLLNLDRVRLEEVVVEVVARVEARVEFKFFEVEVFQGSEESHHHKIVRNQANQVQALPLMLDLLNQLEKL